MGSEKIQFTQITYLYLFCMGSHRRVALIFIVGLVGCSAQEGGGGAEAGDEPKEKSKREIVSQYNYCQEDDCYELLGVKKTSAQPAIKRAYRKLAAEWHPDKNPDPKAKVVFPKYANAYSVLSDPAMRDNYDYLMAHPHEFPSFFMTYSKPVYAPPTDVRFVILLTLLIISGIQYMFKQSQYKTLLEAMKKDPRYQDRLKLIVSEASAKSPKKAGSGFRGAVGTTKGAKEAPKPEILEERRKEAEVKLLAELASQLPAEPKLVDTVAVDMFKLPLTIGYALKFNLGWLVSFRLLGKEYGPAEHAYLTRKAVGLSAKEWDASDEAEKEDLLERELWLAENLEAWHKELDSTRDPSESSPG